MAHALTVAMGILRVRFRQNIYTRAVQKIFLKTKLTFALRKLFERQFAVKSDHMRRKLPKPLRQYNTALRKVLARQLSGGFCRAFHQIGQTNSKFDHALVIVIVEWLRNHATFIEYRPELIYAAGIVMADAHRRLAGIAAHNNELHTFS